MAEVVIAGQGTWGEEEAGSEATLHPACQSAEVPMGQD